MIYTVGVTDMMNKESLRTALILLSLLVLLLSFGQAVLAQTPPPGATAETTEGSEVPAGELPAPIATRLPEGAVVSRTLTKGESGSMTLFAFAEGQDLSEHTAPFDAYVLVLEGRMAFNIGETALDAEDGQMVLMPANVPHALAALEDTKMLLIMLRS